MVFWFIPGTFCEVMPSRYVHNPETAERRRWRGFGRSSLQSPRNNNQDEASEEVPAVHPSTRITELADEHEWDDYENVADAIAMETEGGLEDLLSDFLSIRFM